jgi:hypothetical protein
MDEQPESIAMKNPEHKSGTTNDAAREVATKSELSKGRTTLGCVSPAPRDAKGNWPIPSPMAQRRAESHALSAMTWRVALFGSVIAACSTRIPHPSYTTHPVAAAADGGALDELVEVDYPPPPARVEFVPARPSDDAVWLNGEWAWTGRRWGWKPGGWVTPPSGASYAKWVVVRRTDGKLFSARGQWLGADGGEIPPPEFLTASSVKTSGVVDPEGDPAPTATDLGGDAGLDAAPEGG